MHTRTNASSTIASSANVIRFTTRFASATPPTFITAVVVAITACAIMPAGVAAAATTAGAAIDVDVINNLGATAKALLQGNAALIIDGLILAGAAYGSAQTRTPGPLIFGIISCAIFHIGVKALLT